MSATVRWATALVALGFLAACSGPRTESPNIGSQEAAAEAEKQRELVAKRIYNADARLRRVAYPIYVGGAELCGDVLTPTLGMRALASQYLEGEHAGAMARHLKLSDRPQIVQVYAGSPAEEAGLQVGDKLMKIGETEVQSGRDGETLQKLLEEALVSGQSLTVTVQRDNQTIYANPVPVDSCDYGLVLVDDTKVNAFADGERIGVNRGMLRMAENDQHLAVIIGHELAHNTMEHIDSKKTNAVVGGAGGLLLDIGLALIGVNTQGAFMKAGANAGSAAYSVGFEQEADYIGLYFLARGGYPVEGAADIWRLMAAENPKAITHSRTHPTTTERFLALEQAIEEIKEKQQAGEPLLPEVLPDPSGADGDNQFLKTAYPE